jgi:hypothetical protein
MSRSTSDKAQQKAASNGMWVGTSIPHEYELILTKASTYLVLPSHPLVPCT